MGGNGWAWAASWEGDEEVWTSPVRRMKKGKERDGGKGRSWLVSWAVGLHLALFFFFLVSCSLQSDPSHALVAYFSNPTK